MTKDNINKFDINKVSKAFGTTPEYIEYMFNDIDFTTHIIIHKQVYSDSTYSTAQLTKSKISDYNNCFNIHNIAKELGITLEQLEELVEESSGNISGWLYSQLYKEVTQNKLVNELRYSNKDMTMTEYNFFLWLIVEKGYTQYTYSELTHEYRKQLTKEFINWYTNLK